MWLNSDKVAVQTPHLHSNHRGINVRGKKILIQQNLSPTLKRKHGHSFQLSAESANARLKLWRYCKTRDP